MRCLLYIYCVYILIVIRYFSCFGVILLLSYGYSPVILRHWLLSDRGIPRNGKHEGHGWF